MDFLKCFLGALLCIGSLAADAAPVKPVAQDLKQRQPNWRPQVLETHSQGNPAAVLFYEQVSEEKEVPVKQLNFYENGALKSEIDLTSAEENSPGFQEWKTTL